MSLTLFCILVEGCGTVNVDLIGKEETIKQHPDEALDISDNNGLDGILINNRENEVAENDDYSQFLNYLWVSEDWTENKPYLSLRIDSIDNNMVLGKVNKALAYRGYDRQEDYLDDVNMRGEMVEGNAICAFDIYGGGSIRIEFKNETCLVVDILYDERNKDTNDLHNGTHTYRPYHITDFAPGIFVEDKTLRVETTLETWGEVTIVSGRMETNHPAPDVIVTDREGNILSYLDAPYQYGTSVKEVAVDDVDGDGLKDIIVVTCFAHAPDELNFTWIFHQLGNRWFRMEKNMTKRDNAQKDNTDKNNIDYSQFANYIWITHDWKGNSKPYLSFCIDSIDNGILLGRVSREVAFRYGPQSDRAEAINMWGSLVNGIAECSFDMNGKGFACIEFVDKDVLIVDVKYTEQNQCNDGLKGGVYTYRPYHITDYGPDRFFEDKTLQVETTLELWGEVIIIAGRTEEARIVPSVFLADKNGNLLYKFAAPYQHGTSVQKIIVEDINGDGLQDVKVTTGAAHIPEPDEYSFIWDFYQREDGWFDMERSGYME